MMHDASGTFGMSWFMGLALVVPLAALGVALYALYRSHAARRTPPDAAGPAGAAPPLDAAALRLLDEDERRLYEVLVQRGGDVPQGDLPDLSGFSKAKVSRVLDRLEHKGLVVRVRRGMGNRVVLSAPGRT